jgi:hypothetical protein
MTSSRGTNAAIAIAVILLAVAGFAVVVISLRRR